jgi:hypothetical protein
MRMHAAVVGVALLLAFPAVARVPAPTDDQVRQQIIQQSVADYHGTGHPCACPYDRERNGRMCGRVSGYSRPGGAAPLCYAQDVSDGILADWRRRNGQ